jgi:hypothetical protein
MTAIFDALPGIEVPVGEIAASLARMWDDRAEAGQPAPAADEVKATQVNFVLRFGRATTPDDALRQFRTTVRFSTRYPSRVVVLCPLPTNDPATEMRAKIYGECFLGRTKSDARCCEFVLLSYPMSARVYLESQVSVCLSPDLPLYYWAHRFSECARLAEYRYLLTRARRFLFDTAVAPADALTFPWPNPAAVRDLAFARTLPVRQSVGQLPPIGSPGYHVLLACVAIFILGPLGGISAAFMNFSIGFFHRRPGAGGHPRQHGHAAVRPGGQARRELHADDGGLGRRHVRHGGAGAGDGLAGAARAAGLAARPLFHVHRHVRRRRGHALHADARGPDAAGLSLGLRGGEHPPRAHGQEPAQALHRQARRRHGDRLCRRPGLAEDRPGRRASACPPRPSARA